VLLQHSLHRENSHTDCQTIENLAEKAHYSSAFTKLQSSLHKRRSSVTLRLSRYFWIHKNWIFWTVRL